ncbi:hypothetical protein ScPMuIL_014697 [Solemya velum]
MIERYFLPDFLFDYTSFLLIVISLCVIIGTLAILRLSSGAMLPLSSSVFLQREVTEQPMMSRANPFSVVLSDQRTTSFKDGVYLDVTTLRKSEIQFFWSVDVNQFHKELQGLWVSMLEKLSSGYFLDEAVLERSSPLKFEAGEKMTSLHIKVPEGLRVDSLGPVPRSVYPLVTVIYCTDTQGTEDTEDEWDEDRAVTAMFSVIHLKDQLCSLSSHVMNQFLKTNINEVYQLQPLFVPSNSTEEEEGDIDSDSAIEASVLTTSTNTGTESENRTATRERVDVSSEILRGNGICVTSTNTGTESENRTATRERVDVSSEILRGNGICVICQTDDVQQVFLPCRHACVCNSCFVRLDKCPLCRTDITTHFQLSCADGPSEMIQCEIDQSNMNSQSWWETLNERLNNFFGFT